MQIKCYLQTFNSTGQYTGVWRDITLYLSQLGSFSVDVDSTDFQIGVYRNANVSMSLSNRDGLFSDVGQPTSIFNYTRSNSLVKFTYAIQDEGPYAGMMVAGTDYLSDEVEFFRGLLSDSATSMTLKTEQITFTVLGRESVLDSVLVPSVGLTNGQTVSSILYTLLNQSLVTNILTVSSSNFAPTLNAQVDVVTNFQSASVKTVLDELLLISNSVLTIVNDAVAIGSRQPTSDVKKIFYGQASKLGPENIIDIQNIVNGYAKLFNQVTWNAGSSTSPTTPTAVYQNNASIAKYGLFTYDLSPSSITTTSTQLSIAQAAVTEFGLPKRQMDLTTPLTYDTLSLNLLDRVAVDYPTVYVSEGFSFPICGVAVCGAAVLPRGIWSFQIDTTTNWKIIKKTVNASKFEVTLTLREI